MLQKLCFLLFIVVYTSFSYSQEENKIAPSLLNGFETTYNDGIVMPHNETIDYLTNEHIRSFSFHLIHTTQGESLWKKIYHHPIIGFGFNYSTLGNESVFGKAFSVYPFFESTFLTVKDYLQLNYRISYGLSYITETYDLQNNYENIAISSNMNIYFNLMLNANLRITNHTHLFAATGLTHFSNGKIKAPNKGINTITNSLGIRYFMSSQKFSQKPSFEKPEISDKNKFSIIWSHGYKEHSRFINGYFYISSLNLAYERKYKHWAQYQIGLDAFYDRSLRIRIEGDPRDKFPDHTLYRIGLHAGHNFLFGKLALTVQLGHYVYNKRFFITDFYNRVGLKYYFDSQWIANMSLKSHNANAEFIEFGFGYYWN